VNDLSIVLFIFETIVLTRLIAYAGFNIVRCCEGSRAPVRGGEYDLIGVLLSEIRHCENARDIGFAFFIRDNITGAVGLDPGGNQLLRVIFDR
jgi:hypothetical protein